MAGYRLTRAPGSTYGYSKAGMGLLENLLVRRAGVADYEALLVERITDPLGMDSTRIEMTPEMRSRLAAPHTASRAQTSLTWDRSVTVTEERVSFVQAALGGAEHPWLGDGGHRT